MSTQDVKIGVITGYRSEKVPTLNHVRAAKRIQQTPPCALIHSQNLRPRIICTVFLVHLQFVNFPLRYHGVLGEIRSHLHPTASAEAAGGRAPWRGHHTGRHRFSGRVRRETRCSQTIIDDTRGGAITPV